MLCKKIIKANKDKVETILNYIENVSSEDFRELLMISQLTLTGFVDGILELPQDEQEVLQQDILRDETISLILRDELQKWLHLQNESKAEILKKVYDQIHTESKIVHKVIINPDKQNNQNKYARMRLKTSILHLLDLHLSKTPMSTISGRNIYYETVVLLSEGSGLVGLGFCEPYKDKVCTKCKKNDVDYCRCCSINKSIKSAKIDLFRLTPVNHTLPCKIIGKSTKTEIRLFPAEPNTGIITTEESVRFILQRMGLRDVNTELIGDNSRRNVLKAFKGGIEKAPNVYHIKKRFRSSWLKSFSTR